MTEAEVPGSGLVEPVLGVDDERLRATLMELKEIGNYDAATGLRDVRRLALTDEDDAARRLVVGWSHTPREYSNPQAYANGVNLLANAALRLANETRAEP